MDNITAQRKHETSKRAAIINWISNGPTAVPGSLPPDRRQRAPDAGPASHGEMTTRERERAKVEAARERRSEEADAREKERASKKRSVSQLSQRLLYT